MSLFKISMTMVPRRVLLVVDEDPQVCRMMRRCLGAHFNEIHTAAEPYTASGILAKQRVTHLLCEHFLGGTITGAELICFSRWEYPSIERAVIFTAGDLLEARAQGTAKEIDAVVAKTDGIDATALALLGDTK